MAEALKRMVVKTARSSALPYALAGVLIAAVACHLIDWAFLKTAQRFVPNMVEIVGAGLLLLAVILRFKQG